MFYQTISSSCFYLLILAIPTTICVSSYAALASLNNSQFIYSPTQQLYAAGMRNNQFGVYQAYAYGNVTSTSIWTASQLSTPADAYLSVQGDRNLAICTASGSVLWSPNVYNNGTGLPFCLKILDSGNLIWVDNATTIIWQSNSSG
ncbi:unnamed protein product [Adineta steineri]|uniref:Bulb-type lectin domain-containing protein n=1 Tax=Adineta steineri TaxID=433720 RepID=A0A816ALL2_9BILA|nr:unnamed protein product [Adineta steineri]CAF1597499.1 unnamed protein product [Adineta steineri]